MNPATQANACSASTSELRKRIAADVGERRLVGRARGCRSGVRSAIETSRDHPDREQQRRGDEQRAAEPDAQHRPRVARSSARARRACRACPATSGEVVGAHALLHRQPGPRLKAGPVALRRRRRARGSSRRGCRAARRGSPARPRRPPRGCRCRRPTPRCRCRTGTCRSRCRTRRPRSGRRPTRRRRSRPASPARRRRRARSSGSFASATRSRRSSIPSRSCSADVSALASMSCRARRRDRRHRGSAPVAELELVRLDRALEALGGLREQLDLRLRRPGRRWSAASPSASAHETETSFALRDTDDSPPFSAPGRRRSPRIASGWLAGRLRGPGRRYARATPAENRRPLLGSGSV